MLADLEALAPPAIMCAAFLAGVVWLLRHEMAPKRRSPEAEQQGEDAASDQRT